MAFAAFLAMECGANPEACPWYLPGALITGDSMMPFATFHALSEETRWFAPTGLRGDATMYSDEIVTLHRQCESLRSPGCESGS